MRKKMARWFLVGVLALDGLLAVAFLVGGLSGFSVAQESGAATGKAEGDAAKKQRPPAPEALRLLGEKLAERSVEIERRETEVEELLRGSEVLRQAGLLPPPAEGTEPDAAGPAAAAESKTSTAFLSLQRAYENMEPESAALAIAELAARDKEAVVELLLGWKPRTSGAILDALTQTNPALAADLSYEIWKRDGRAKG